MGPLLAGCLLVFLPVQGDLLLLAMKHMRGGSLGSVLKNAETCHMLQWENRCAPAACAAAVHHPVYCTQFQAAKRWHFGAMWWRLLTALPSSLLPLLLAAPIAGGARWQLTLPRPWTTCTQSSTSCTATSRAGERLHKVLACALIGAAGRAGGVGIACLPAGLPAGLHAGLPACQPACVSYLPSFLSWLHFVFCSNVLLDENLRAFVADLGVAQALGSKARTAVGGTRLYAGASTAAAAAGVVSQECSQLVGSCHPHVCPFCCSPRAADGRAVHSAV